LVRAVPARLTIVMKLTGEITVDAPRQKIFEALCDPHFFASCIEGVKDLKPLEGNRYDAVLETRVAYLRFRFKVVVELARIDAPHEIEARIEGTPMGVVGRLAATSVTRFTEEEGKTKMAYVIDTALTGKLGALGQPVLKAKAKEMEKQFKERVRKAFETPAATPAQ
jgi:uncharacterized protein